MRLLVYSHDAFGLGNIRRMLSVCRHLLENIPEVSILVLSGSPAIQNFTIPVRLDYIKLPFLGRDRNGNLAAKYLTSDVAETVQLRSNLIKTAIINFKPDLILVDKKPYGLLGELKASLDLLKTHAPRTKLVLLLRDVLDSPQVTIKEWQKQRYYQAIQYYYDRVLVVGTAEVFNLVKEYQFPQIIKENTIFCGYLRKKIPKISVELIREKLNLKEQEQLIVVTPGGGEDGYSLIKNYLLAISNIRSKFSCKTLIVFGSEMPSKERQELLQTIDEYSNIITLDFTEHLMNYLQSADLVVSMAGYNTITEILSLGKKAVVVPRCKPSQEQLIRALRMESLGLLSAIAPDNLTPENLGQAISQQLDNNHKVISNLNFDGLINVQREILNLLPNHRKFGLPINSRYFNSFYPIAI
ncbi:putative glycosyl transferase [Xenococcus sp. PCC 7305]|uniref:glycosyltransferase family protein n=1 Tax=Xenococcus sp. PCC 7305 TaxID=102125 RepID=UPI0002AD123E|nr:glycosyltransferase [Xenococcus sp. PCC 7305]ELS03718.1 putative glycosyl transferase [Xenococcus sp. PCC 7305]